MRSRAFVCALLALLFTSSGCRIESDTSPPRPAGLPDDAVWVGGSDGGVFVRLASERDDQTYSGTIYHPDGEVWYQGRLVASSHTRADKRFTVSDAAAWDGTQLLLNDGGALVAQDTPRR